MERVNQDDVNKSILERSLQRVIKEEGYTTYSFTHRPFTSDGANFLGKLLEIDIKGQTVDGEKETNLIVKKPSTDEDMVYGFFNIAGAHSMELYFYDEVAVIYKELQEEANVPAEERYKTTKSFDVPRVNKPQILILENLSKKGFKIPPRMDVVPLKYAELSIQELAKFHGLSFVLEHKRPEYFDCKIRTIKPLCLWNDSFIKFYTNFIRMSINSLEDEASIKKVEDFIPTFFDKFPKYLQNMSTSVTCGLCYSDYRHCNILKTEVDGEVAEVMPVDYQLLFYGSLVMDFIYFIFLGTNRQFRTDHLSHLKNLYHNTLRRFLKYFDMDVDKIYSREQFESDFKERLDYGLMVAVAYLPLTFVTGNDAPDLNTINEGGETLATNKLKERLHDIVNEFVEWGYL